MRSDRALTNGEWAALSPGLAQALLAAGAQPRIKCAAHASARLAALWRRTIPILTRGDDIWWPEAAPDVSASPAMALLQHELQHVLDYRNGRLTGLGYLCNPHHWRYDYRLGPDTRWDALGAEQRAMVAEHIWLMENGRAPAGDLERLRTLTPWAGGAPGGR